LFASDDVAGNVLLEIYLKENINNAFNAAFQNVHGKNPVGPLLADGRDTPGGFEQTTQSQHAWQFAATSELAPYGRSAET
jgi:hypothetical protein